MTLLPGFDPISGADFSPCGVFRYRLWRTWNPNLPALVVCMLNPSTADAEEDDPTVRRCIGFAKLWGYGGLTVVNKFALRATNPNEIISAKDPIGPCNDWTIKTVIRTHGEILVAWGATDWGAFKDRAEYLLNLFRQEGKKIYCLGKTKHGYPRHPLYVRADQKREIF